MTFLKKQTTQYMGVMSVLVLISGCSSTPVTDTTRDTLAQTQKAVTAGHEQKWASLSGDLLTPGDVVSGNWWTSLNDPHLNQIIDQAVGKNYSVWQAKAQVLQAKAQAIVTGAASKPAASIGTSPSYLRLGNGSSSSTTTESYGLDLAVSWEVDVWGRLKSQTQSAKEYYLASNEGLRAVRQTVAAQTAKAYFATVQAKQQVALSKETLAVLSETARQIGNRADVGIASPSDKHLSISNRESAAAGLAGQEEALARASRQLQFIATDYPDGKIKTSESLVALPKLPSVGIPASLLSRRPDVLAAERELRATGFLTETARRALLPNISLATSLGTLSDSFSDILDGDFSYWSLAGSVIKPLFVSGRLRANVELQEAVQQEAAGAYAETVLTAFTEVESALAARELINRRQAALCNAANASKAAERVSLNRYQQGLEPYLTVLESQQRALSAASSCISARFDALDNYIDLQLALGGGFEERQAK
ncbi:efflux transporter outer membrane subunit [Leucothrix sargassi]|nr:efflux transporter outer membrane subunit [Leucothrix sargassi]